MQVSAEDDVVDDDEVLLPVVKFGVTVVKNVPVRSKSRMVPSVKPAITKHPDDVAVIDVHSSLMGNDVESPRNDFDVDGIFSHKTAKCSAKFCSLCGLSNSISFV